MELLRERERERERGEKEGERERECTETRNLGSTLRPTHI